MSLRDMTIVSLFPHRLADMPMPGMPMAMTPGAWSGGLIASSSSSMWWVMMIAMMTPSAAPTILLDAHATRHAQGTGELPPGLGAHRCLCRRLSRGMARLLADRRGLAMGARAIGRAVCDDDGFHQRLMSPPPS